MEDGRIGGQNLVKNVTSNLKSCSTYGSVCNGNERAIVDGQYLLGFYVRGNEFE